MESYCLEVLKEENLRVTFIPRQTGAETLDVNQDILNGFTYYSEGYYELPYAMDLENAKLVKGKSDKVLARLKRLCRIKFQVKAGIPDDHARILVSGKDEERKEPYIFSIPSVG
ncbi:hypothetical protein CS542_02225 [Pedobacter sp. IW39]|nr:hypothetical protein CS542_02225 [Pedobacter sp. IW39]